MSVNKKCKYCGGDMHELKKEKIADTSYHFMKCELCNKEVARREE